MDDVVQLKTALAGRYEVDREIGAGGMATVYLARDVKHNRKVALKVLNPELGAVLGADRFLAEIQVTANLQHPHLLPLFDSGEANGLLFYVMPYVEGESLRARIMREKQLPVAEAVRIAVAVANALDYAHGHGVIHRDLKPENILLQAGQPVVADFGIALAVSKAGGARVTQTGISLGTPQYMSPEQATGDRAIDGRTDIYSLGALTYEMLSGDAPYVASTAQAIIAKVLTERPTSVRLARPTVPKHVAAAIERSLEKLPADRWSTAREFAEAIEGRVVSGATPSAERSNAVPHLRGRLRAVLRSPVLWASAFIVATVSGVAGWLKAARPALEPAVRIQYSAAPNEPLGNNIGRNVALSPDGLTLVYATNDSNGFPQLFIRKVTELEQHPLPGGERGLFPFLSPDGRWIGFTDGTVLRKLPVEGGAPTTLADLREDIRGASWGPDGRIVVSAGGRLVVVSAGGGGILDTPEKRDSAQAFWPAFVARDVVVYSARPGSDQPIMAIELSSRRTVALENAVGSYPVGMVAGHLVYGRIDGTLMAVPFDSRRLRTFGATRTVGDAQVGPATGQVKAAVSASGSLVYVSGGGKMQLVAVDSRGAPRILPVPPGRLNNPRLSPDGRRVALDITTTGRVDVWVFELSSGASARLTSEGTANIRPEWTPDGRSVLFRTNRAGRHNSLWVQPADGSGPARPLMSSPGRDVWQGIITPDGRTVICRTGSVGAAQIRYRRLEGDTIERLIRTDSAIFTEWGMRLSPDGRWLTYGSNESGAQQVYVRPFPGPGARFPVSVSGGSTPMWSRDGRYIYFFSGPLKFVAASVETNPTFRVTAREVLFEFPYLTNPGHATFDVSRDGREFVMLRPVIEGAERIVVIHNWKRELLAGSASAQ